MREIGLRAVLLPLLRQPRFGLELTREVHRRSGGRLQAGPGSLYPALRKLEAQGLARSWTLARPHAGRGRPRRYYELTARGAREVQDLQQALRSAAGDATATPDVPSSLMEERVRRARDLSVAARRLRASMIDATPGA